MLDKSEFEKFADELAKKYPLYAIQSAEIAMKDMMDFHLGMIPEYPKETMGRLYPPDGSSWLKTDKQRGWFFAAVQAGEIPGWTWIEATEGEEAHPQKIGGARTGNLGRAKGREVYKEESSVVGSLGFDSAIAPYAPWVVGDDYPGSVVGGEQMYQARIHVDRWWQFGGIINENLEPGWNVFNQTFWEEFGKRINENG